MLTFEKVLDRVISAASCNLFLFKRKTLRELKWGFGADGRLSIKWSKYFEFMSGLQSDQICTEILYVGHLVELLESPDKTD